MRFITAPATAVFFLTAPLPAAAQQGEMAEVEINAEVAAGNVHILYGRGGNIAVLTGPDGIVLIDDQFAPLTDRIRAKIAEFASGPVRFVVNTHWHFDHVGGNENFGAAGALIVAHDNVRMRMSSEQVIEAFGRTVPPSPDAALPVITFTDRASLHVNEEMRAHHIPHAHTDGDSLIHFTASNVIHMGDIMFNGMYPFIDLASGGNIEGMIAGADEALALADDQTIVIPGHGPATDRAGLADYRAMLVTVRDDVAAMIEAGKSREDILAAKPTDAFDERLGGGFVTPDQFAGFVYDSLAAR